MKKTIIMIAIPIIIVLFSTVGLIVTKNTSNRIVRQFNVEYEYYKNRVIYGTELATVINKTINENEKNNIAKDEKQYYVDDNATSIRVVIKIIATDKTYTMEEIYKNDTTRFVEIYGGAKFRCMRN